MNEKDLDSLAREQISKVLDKNLFVEASAGSGKTTSLVNRMIALVESGEPVESICTITFTKAAADEFFVRFQEMLSNRSVPQITPDDRYFDEKNETTIKRCQEALSKIDLCFLGTIDSFLNMIANELPIELGIPANNQIITNEERDDIIIREYHKMLEDVDSPLHEMALRVDKDIYSAEDAFKLLVFKLYERREAEVIYDKSEFDYVGELEKHREWLLNVIENIYKYGKSGNKDIQEAISDLKNSRFFLFDSKSQDIIRHISQAVKKVLKVNSLAKEVVDTPLGEFYSVPEKARSAKPDDSFVERLTKIQDLVEEYKYKLLMNFTTEALDTIVKELYRQGKFTFYDYLFYITKALQKSASGDREVIDHLFKKHPHILVDESQDTNPLQTQLLFYLTSTKKSDNWKESEPKESSLFIVGDPKQSIYCFRGANVSAYNQTKELFANKDEVLILSKNFRSNPNLKRYFNDTMNDVLNTKEDALTHPNIPIGENEERDVLINNHPEVLDGVFKYSTNEDVDYVVKTIEFLVNSRRWKVVPKKNGKDGKPQIRDIRYSDFLVVPMTKTKADEYIKAFNEHNIPLMVEITVPFVESKTLVVLKDLLYLLKQPENNMFFLNVVNGDLFSFNNQDVIEMINDGFKLNIAEILDDDGNFIKFKRQEHAHAVKLLNDLYLKTKNLSYSSTLIYLLNYKDLRLFDVVDSNYLEYTYFMLEKVKEAENNGIISSFAQMKAFIDNMLSSQSDDERVLRFKDEVDKVKLANLHKVKGLQAPIVILNKPTIKKGDVNDYVDYSSGKPVIYFKKIVENVDNKPRTYVYTKQFDSISDSWNHFDEAEHRRKEYVAATRAESVLIVGEKTDPRGQKNPWEELIKKIDQPFPLEEGDFSISKDSIKCRDISFVSSINETSNSPTFERRSPSDLRTQSRIEKLDEIVEQETIDKATIIGTCIHSILERIVNSSNNFETEDLVDSTLSNYNLDESYKDLLLRVANVIRHGGYKQKESSLKDDILNTLLNAKNVMCEVPFSFKENNQLVSGVIDCVYEDENGWHIIDYKTGRNDNVKSLEVHYKDQLACYKKALYLSTGIEADTHIYHIDVNLDFLSLD